MVLAIPSLKRRLVISTAVMPSFSLSTFSGIFSEVTTAWSILIVCTACCFCFLTRSFR